jgi:FkbM family methyltransferase
MAVQEYRVDDRGIAKKLKSILPEDIFCFLRRIFNGAVGVLPYRIKYPLGTYLRRNKLPYKWLEPGDIAVQVGAPRDMLLAGRSRAIHFARLVGTAGKIVIIEPDPENVAYLQDFVRRYGLQGNTMVVGIGAWKERTELMLLTNTQHPAAGVLEGLKGFRETLSGNPEHEKIKVAVDTLDAILNEANVSEVKIVSITTNGAELEILAGMQETIRKGCQHISLASTGEGYVEYMARIGFEYYGRDDRGYSFRANK